MKSGKVKFYALAVLAAVLVVMSVGSGAFASTESRYQQVKPRSGLWQGPSVSFFVNPNGSIQDFSMRANLTTSWCQIEADELSDQPDGGLEYVMLYPESGYWYGELSTHEERLAQAAEQGASWPETVETDDGYMIKAINIVGTFTSATTIEGTYRINVCEDQLFLYMEGFGVHDWSAEWVSETTAPVPTEPPTPNMTATYERLMADALATVTASSWTSTPAPTSTPLPTPTATPIPPQKISAENIQWLEEKAWVKIFGDPEEIQWSVDGSTLVTSTGFLVALFDPADLQAEPFRQKDTFGFVNAVAVSPDGVTVAYGDGDANIVLWNMRTDAETILRGHTNSVQGLAFSADGSRLASTSWDTTVRIWDVETGKELAFFDGFTDFGYAVAFRPDAQILAGVGQHHPEQGVRLWDTQTFEELPMLRTDQSLACVAFSPDGRLMVAGAEWDAQWFVWDAQSFERVLTLGQSTREPESGTCSVAFSPDSTLLATGGGGNLIHIWDVAPGSPTFGQELISLRRHTDTVLALAFSPDGTVLASGGDHNDSTIRLWAIGPDAPRGE